MKKIAIVLFFVSSIVFGQEKITKKLGDFTVIKTYRGLTVELIKSDTPEVVITGKKSKEVIIKNINGVLKITMTALETFSAKQVKVTVYYTNNIDIIDANEGSIISTKEYIEQEKIEVKAQEAGRIYLKIKTTHLDVKTISGAQIIIEGSSKNQNVIANTGGIYKAANLKTDSTKVVASSGGTVTINASELADANAKIGAVITITGNPSEIIKRESLGGYVRE